LHKLLQYPISSVEQPVAMLGELMAAYEVHKRSPEYEEAVKRSKQRESGHMRLSKDIWWAQYNHQRGLKLAHDVRDKTVNFFDLARSDQQLVEDFDTLRSEKKLRSLLSQNAEKVAYPGSGSSVAHPTGAYRAVLNTLLSYKQ
tara:strand:+ start:96 stop:524 length:429 start_codon:yes stop_codon:yes gene_type:complete